MSLVKNLIAYSQGNMSTRALGRIATHPVIVKKVQAWRKEHDDWKNLAAFLLSKNTGRRFKKKKRVSDSVENLVERTGDSGKSASVSCSDHESDIDSDATSAEGKAVVLDKRQTSPDCWQSENRSDPDRDQQSENSPGRNQQSENRPCPDRDQKSENRPNPDRNQSGNSKKQMVVKKLTLEELSGEGDIKITEENDSSVGFLFEASTPSKKKDSFFLGSGDSSDGEQEEADDKETSQNSDSAGTKDVLCIFEFPVKVSNLLYWEKTNAIFSCMREMNTGIFFFSSSQTKDHILVEKSCFLTNCQKAEFGVVVAEETMPKEIGKTPKEGWSVSPC